MTTSFVVWKDSLGILAFIGVFMVEAMTVWRNSASWRAQ